MSRITDALDTLEVELPKTPDAGLVGTDPSLFDRARAALDEVGIPGLARAFRGEVEALGFSPRTAEPFYLRAAADALEAPLAALLDPAARTLPLPPDGGVLWGSHRGHAVFLPPTTLGARGCLALRVAEVLDASRALGERRAALARSVRGLRNPSELDVALLDPSVGALVAALDAAPLDAGPPSPSEVAVAPAPSLAWFDGRGGALLLRTPSEDSPFALVERGGRPYAASLGLADLEALLAFLHALIDVDAPSPSLFAFAGLRAQPGAAPELFGAPGSFGVVASP